MEPFVTFFGVVAVFVLFVYGLKRFLSRNEKPKGGGGRRGGDDQEIR